MKEKRLHDVTITQRDIQRMMTEMLGDHTPGSFHEMLGVSDEVMQHICEAATFFFRMALLSEGLGLTDEDMNSVLSGEADFKKIAAEREFDADRVTPQEINDAVGSLALAFFIVGFETHKQFGAP